MKRPVSVTRPTYSALAISGVISASSSFAIRHTISAVQDATEQTRFTVPKRVLSWWWSMLRMCSPSAWRKSTGMRSMLPQSRKTIVRSATSSGGAPTRPSKWSPRYSHGSGNSSGDMYIRESLPSCVRMPCIASSEPSASPSGFSCVVRRSLSADRSSPTTWSCSVVTLMLVVVQQLCDPHPSVYRLVEDELKRGGALHPQLACHGLLKDARARTRAPRASPRAPRRFRARTRTRAPGANRCLCPLKSLSQILCAGP